MYMMEFILTQKPVPDLVLLIWYKGQKNGDFPIGLFKWETSIVQYVVLELKKTDNVWIDWHWKSQYGKMI